MGKKYNIYNIRKLTRKGNICSCECLRGMKDERRGKTKEIENHGQNSCDDVGKGQRT